MVCHIHGLWLQRVPAHQLLLPVVCNIPGADLEEVKLAKPFFPHVVLGLLWSGSEVSETILSTRGPGTAVTCLFGTASILLLLDASLLAGVLLGLGLSGFLQFVVLGRSWPKVLYSNQSMYTALYTRQFFRAWPRRWVFFLVLCYLVSTEVFVTTVTVVHAVMLTYIYTYSSFVEPTWLSIYCCCLHLIHCRLGWYPFHSGGWLRFFCHVWAATGSLYTRQV